MNTFKKFDRQYDFFYLPIDFKVSFYLIVYKNFKEIE